MTDVSLRYLLFGDDRSASKAVKGVESTATRSSKVVGASFAKMGSMIGGEVGDLVSRVGEGLTSLGDSAKGMGPKLQVAGGALAGVGAGLSMLGSADKQAEAALSAAFTGIGKSVDDYKSKVEEVIKQQENYNHSAAETQNALANLTTMTKDPTKALDSMGLVANLAAARHISLDSAATMVGRTLNGNTKLFKMYGINVTSTATASTGLSKAQVNLSDAGAKYHTALGNLRLAQQSIAHGEVSGAEAKKLLAAETKKVSSAYAAYVAKQAAVKKAQDLVKLSTNEQKAGLVDISKRLSGQAAASVDSFGGRLSVLKTKILDGAAAFGNKFGPALQVGGTTLMAVGTVLEIVRGRQAAAAVATNIETAAVERQTIVSKGAAAAQWLLNTAMSANPIGLIVIAIVALVAAFVLAWKHSQIFRTIITGAFNAVKDAALFVVNWIKAHWPLLLAILTGPIGIAVLLIVSHWNAIKNGLHAVITWITGAWNGFVSFLTGIGSKIASVGGTIWNGFLSGFKGIINGIIDIWNRLHFTIPSINIGPVHFGGGTIGVRPIPHLANGGTLTTAGMVMVGERGPEYLHLPRGAQVRPLAAGPGGGGADTQTFRIELAYPGAQALQTLILTHKRLTGQTTLGIG
jgi:hypothetical protein